MALSIRDDKRPGQLIRPEPPFTVGASITRQLASIVTELLPHVNRSHIQKQAIPVNETPTERPAEFLWGKGKVLQHKDQGNF